jgi:hypothetical protein
MFTHRRVHFYFFGSILIAVLGASALMPGPAVRAQSTLDRGRTTFAPANSVSFTLALEKNVFGVRESIPVKYRIENVSNSFVYVPRGFEITGCLHIGPPPVSGSFVNSEGKHFAPGYGTSCGGTPGVFDTLTQRMSIGTVLLHPGEQVDGILQLDPTMFGGLPPGRYRVEAVLRGWNSNEFTDAELAELATMGSPFLRGEVLASIKIQLIP